MRKFVLIFGVLLGGPAFAQAPLSVVKGALVWKHPESVFQVEVLGKTIQRRPLTVSKTGARWDGKELSPDSSGLDWCLWMLFGEQSLTPALTGLKEPPRVVVERERIGVLYEGRGELLIDFETNLPVRLTFVREGVSWGISWATPGSWDDILIYRDGAPQATIRGASPPLKED